VSSFVICLVASVCSCVSRGVRARLVVEVDLSFFKNVKGTKKKYNVKIICMNKVQSNANTSQEKRIRNKLYMDKIFDR
jgi:hypothetical protein